MRNFKHKGMIKRPDKVAVIRGDDGSLFVRFYDNAMKEDYMFQISDDVGRDMIQSMEKILGRPNQVQKRLKRLEKGI